MLTGDFARKKKAKPTIHYTQHDYVCYLLNILLYLIEPKLIISNFTTRPTSDTDPGRPSRLGDHETHEADGPGTAHQHAAADTHTRAPASVHRY